jgi:hypothetical protein
MGQPIQFEKFINVKFGIAEQYDDIVLIQVTCIISGQNGRHTPAIVTLQFAVQFAIQIRTKNKYKWHYSNKK